MLYIILVQSFCPLKIKITQLMWGMYAEDYQSMNCEIEIT